LTSSRSIFDLANQQKRFQEIEAEISRDGFWDNPDATTAILKERTLLGQRIDAFNGLEKDLEDAGILMELATEEADADTMAEVSGQIGELGRRMHQFSLDMMLDGDDDQEQCHHLYQRRCRWYRGPGLG
jgi:peptide chain release factor 2